MSDFINVISFCLTGLIAGYISGFFWVKISKGIGELVKKTGYHFHQYPLRNPGIGDCSFIFGYVFVFFLRSWDWRNNS